MNFFKVIIMSLLFNCIYCSNLFAVDTCPSSAQISSNELNGWQLYVSTGDLSPYQLATKSQTIQFESGEHPFLQAMWSPDNSGIGLQNAWCAYTYGNNSPIYRLSKTEPAPTAPPWHDYRNIPPGGMAWCAQSAEACTYG